MTKNIVITGATGVLGNLTAKTFAALGHKLALLDIDQNKLDSLTSELNLPSERLYAQTLNLLDVKTLRASAEAASAALGGIHAVFHLVGGWVGGKTFAESTQDDLEFMLNQHVRTTFNLFQTFSPYLAASQWGRVIAISASTVTSPPGKSAVYTATKAAQENFVLSLAAELKSVNVTANIIQVKAIDTENKGTGTTPAEIVSTMKYLFSDEAAKITGARIPLY